MNNLDDISIGGFRVGLTNKPFIIAEMSGNHNQSLERALEIVKAAAESGAHALKLQTYTADTITLNVDDGDFVIKDDSSLWSGNSLHKLYEKAHTPWEWHEPIMQLAKKLGMICFSSPFDESAVDFLEGLNVSAYKIASFENSHLPLIRKVAATGKPMIISTGMASVAEIHEAVQAATEAGCKNLILLKCTSTYPASPENTNVLTIPHMKELFKCQVGLSDHTMGVGASIASVAHGATVIEKHFTLSRADGGVDSTFSLEPDELKSLVVETERAWLSLGSVKYGASDSEEKSRIFRRSLYVGENMAVGDIFTVENLRVVRPGYGLAPKYYENILGKRIRKNAKKGTPIDWELIN
jgi:N-acetylneuraminate synthase